RPGHLYRPVFDRARDQAEAIEIAMFGATDETTGVTVPSLSEQYSRHHGWLNAQSVETVQFEELIGEGATMRSALGRVARHIGPPVSINDLKNGAALRRSATMRNGRSGRWATEIPDHLIARAKDELIPR